MDDLKYQVAEAEDAEEKVAEEERKRILSQEWLKPLKSVVETQSAIKYGIAELFSPASIAAAAGVPRAALITADEDVMRECSHVCIAVGNAVTYANTL